MAFLSNKQCHKGDLRTGEGFEFQKVAQFIEALKFKWDMLNLSKSMVSVNSAESHAGIFMKLKCLSLVSIKPIRTQPWPNSSQNKAISMKDDSLQLVSL